MTGGWSFVGAAGMMEGPWDDGGLLFCGGGQDPCSGPSDPVLLPSLR